MGSTVRDLILEHLFVQVRSCVFCLSFRVKMLEADMHMCIVMLKRNRTGCSCFVVGRGLAAVLILASTCTRLRCRRCFDLLISEWWHLPDTR